MRTLIHHVICYEQIVSVKLGPNEWITDTSRLLLMNMKDFNKLGIGIDDLIDAYEKTVLSSISIDKMSSKLIDDKNDLSF